MTDEDYKALIVKASDLGMLIAPLPEDLDEGSPIERMPDDLLSVCLVLGELCDAIEALIAGYRQVDALLANGNVTAARELIANTTGEQP